MTESTNKKKIAMIEALEKTGGVVNEACEMCNISRSTHYRWCKEDLEYNDSFQKSREVMIDIAEGSLLKQIKSGSAAATIFLLKTRGRNRGYTEIDANDKMNDIVEMSRDMSYKLNKIVLLLNKIKDPEITAQMESILEINKDEH